MSRNRDLQETAPWSRLTVQCREGYFLAAVRIEIGNIQPAFESGLAFGPLGIEHRIPGGVTAATLDDHVLAEDPLESEPEPQRCSSRGGVQRIALPFVPAVPQLFEDVARHQIH